jgi:hypothetical protein
MKAYRESGILVPLILNLGIKCRWVVIFTPRPLTLKDSTQYLLNRMMEGPQIRFGHFGDEKKFFPLLGLEPRIVQPVA